MTDAGQYGYPLLLYQLIIGNYCPVDAYSNHLLEIPYGAGTVGPVSGASVYLDKVVLVCHLIKK